MAKKIGWKMRLRRKLRQQRAEQRIKARHSVKQAKQLGRIYRDMTPEEANAMNEIAPQVAIAEQQLADDGYVVSGEPLETMALYNDVYGEGNPIDDETLEECFGVNEGENFNEESYEESFTELGRSAMDIIETFRDNTQGDERFENLEEDFIKKAKERFKKFKKEIGAEKTKDESKPTNIDSGKIANIFIGAIVGVIVAKFFKL